MLDEKKHGEDQNPDEEEDRAVPADGGEQRLRGVFDGAVRGGGGRVLLRLRPNTTNAEEMGSG